MGQGMPVAEQTALVQKYCVACHYDARNNGGLSLEHFNAHQPDPGVTAMLLSKMKTGAFGAAGLKVPGRDVQNAVIAALSLAAQGADAWSVRTEGRVITAGIVRELPSYQKSADPDLYRLTVVCNPETHAGKVQVAWSPGVPDASQVLLAKVDDDAPASYSLNVTETYANGTKGVSGPGAMVLQPKLPAKTLTVSNIFARETVVFPFDALPAQARQELSACFAR